MALFPTLSFGTNLILFIIVIHIFIMMIERIKKFTTSSNKKSIAILVLGDIGRSPRMQRHGESFLNNLDKNYEIHFIGFIESGIKSTLKNNDRVKLHNIKSIRIHNLLGNNKLSFIIYAIFKVFSEILSLYWILILSSSISSPLTHILMQNPPSIPIVFIAKFTSIIRDSIFIIDWHNFGFSILSLKQKGIMVKIYKFIERYIGKMANIHLTVTDAMKVYLIKQWQFNEDNIYILKDKATEIFLQKTFNEKDDVLLFKDIGKYFNKNKQYESETIKDVKGNNLWMISSTSWTLDEDINMLIDENVLKDIDNKIANNMDKENKIKQIVLFITGKDEGNLKKEFMDKLSKLSLKYIDVIPLWLESPNNYIYLLKYCDIGLCFHLSSSGLDLPMKVVDMFGVGMPVIAINFNQEKMEKVMEISNENKKYNIKTALNELVQHNKNGFVFNTSDELKKYILQIYYDNDKEYINKFKQNIKAFTSHKWETKWIETMKMTKSFQINNNNY